MTKVQSGDRVQIHYTGQLEGGQVFGTSRDGEPISFTVGQREMLPAIDQAVIGMQPGEKKKFRVEPEQGFGERIEELQQRIPRDMLPEDARVGDRFVAQAGGQDIAVWVRELDEESAVIDGNHPLAGQTLTFEIEVISVGEAGLDGSD